MATVSPSGRPDPSAAADPDCVFCGVTRGGTEASVVLRTATVTAFMDRYPVAEGHVLVVPNAHHPSLGDLTDDVGAELWRVATRVAAAVRARSAPAVMLHFSDGEAADQDVPHVHLHVIPRHPGDAVTVDLPGTRPSREELDRVAAGLVPRLG
jgi:histidine triad (HIT) family protein